MSKSNFVVIAAIILGALGLAGCASEPNQGVASAEELQSRPSPPKPEPPPQPTPAPVPGPKDTGDPPPAKAPQMQK